MGKSRLLGTSQRSALMEASLGKKSKAILKTGDAVSEAIDAPGGMELSGPKTEAGMVAAAAGVCEAG